MKTHINITVDLDAYLAIKEQRINISKLISDYLVEYTNVKKPQIKGDSRKEKIQEAKLQQVFLEKEIERLKKEDKEEKQEWDAQHGIKKWVKLD